MTQLKTEEELALDFIEEWQEKIKPGRGKIFVALVAMLKKSQEIEAFKNLIKKAALAERASIYANKFLQRALLYGITLQPYQNMVDAYRCGWQDCEKYK
jgi:hypothetical protein